MKFNTFFDFIQFMENFQQSFNIGSTVSGNRFNTFRESVQHDKSQIKKAFKVFNSFQQLFQLFNNLSTKFSTFQRFSCSQQFVNIVKK